MVAMTITEYWTDKALAGEIKAVITWPATSYETVTEAVKSVSSRFKHRLVHKGKDEVVFDNSIYVQRVSFK